MSIVPTPRRAALAFSVLVGLGVTAAHAQDTAPAAEHVKTTELQTVKVTASKRVENLQKVPVSLTVLTPEKLEAFGQAGLNIHDMVNSSKGELAYTVVDLDGPVPDAVFKQISGIKGVVMARLIQEPK